jgi:hypothetical protein
MEGSKQCNVSEMQRFDPYILEKAKQNQPVIVYFHADWCALHWSLIAIPSGISSIESPIVSETESRLDGVRFC